MRLVRQFIFSIKTLVAVCLVLMSTIGNAGLIKIEESEISAIELSDTFRSFYAFASVTPWSANTGLERANTLVAFLAEYADEQALFLIFSGPGGDAGSANFDIVGSEGGISYVDDPIRTDPVTGVRTPRDPVVGNNVSMTYIEGYTDGLIFSGLFSDDWNIDIDIFSTTGIDNFVFLSFDEDGNESVAYSTSGVPNRLLVGNLELVSAPILSLVTLAGIVLLLRRRA